MTRSLLLLLASFALACGGPSRPTETSRASADDDDEDDLVDEDDYDEAEGEDDELDDDDDGGFIDDALQRAAAEPLELGEREAVPGTGVTMRPPENAMPLPLGGGFLSMAARLQVSVVVAEGPPEVLDQIRTGGNPNAPEPESTDAFEISGQQGQIGRDRIEAGETTLERSWLLVHDGTRALGVIATYEGRRARALRSGVREMLESVEWDRSAELDASEALGITVGPVPGLEMSHRSSMNIVFLAPGAPYPPEAGHAVLTVLPLPMQVPEESRGEACSQIAEQLMPATELESEGEIDDGALPGCERLALADAENDERVIAYAAVLFNGRTPIFLSASASADDLRTWRPRFARAARTVRARPSAVVPATP